MEPEMDDLLEKYWKGETSVAEERLIKAHFAKARDLSPTAQYFKSIDQQKQVKAEGVSWKRKSNYTRFSAAATIVVGLLVAFLTIENNPKKTQYVVEIDDPQEAYEITRNALMMISGGLNEGKQYSEELKKINKPTNKDEDS